MVAPLSLECCATLFLGSSRWTPTPPRELHSKAVERRVGLSRVGFTTDGALQPAHRRLDKPYIQTGAPAGPWNGHIRPALNRAARTPGTRGVKSMTRFRKTLLTLSVPALLLAATLAYPLTLSAGEGRYKVGPKGECYWDAKDNGPDQCKPPEKRGRYKRDGNRCVWDANDTGPYQCEPPK
jgi:hypothetical protein